MKTPGCASRSIRSTAAESPVSFDKESQVEFLWYDASRLPVKPELDYDENFASRIDELLPCDLPEHGVPDHGELWH